MLSNIASGIRTLLTSAPGFASGAGHAQSDFWRRKMFTHFKRMDLNDDGYVSRDDFKSLVRRLAAAAQASEHRAFLMQRLAIQLWEDFWCCEEDKGFDYALPFDEFVQVISNLLRLSDCKKHLAEPLELLFGVLDYDGNGVVTAKEWSDYFSVLGLSEGEAKAAFEACFPDKTQIDKADFIAAGQSFFMLTDEKHGSKELWGPLLTPPASR